MNLFYFVVQLLFKLSISASDAPNKKLLKVRSQLPMPNVVYYV